ncbi:hypothetical protein HN51_055263 [Arachis hypogaea]|uniref:Putative calcium-binding protein n=1 Tax=Arachis hypogaea TaxID=3818 RepID=A0A6B9V9M4_ARAHY|nr:putative calcium-binding protein [Arachis hypogaea]
MWGCFVNSLKSLSSLQATVTNFATNFISSGLAGFFFFFHESLSPQVPTEKSKDNDKRYTGSAKLSYDEFMAMVIAFLVAYDD